MTENRPGMRFGHELEVLLAQVPIGQVTTFGALAHALGDTRAAVPVFRALSRNRPPGWYRVVRKDGTLAFQRAAPPLEKEGVRLQNGRIRNFREICFQGFRSSKPLQALRNEQRSLASQVVLEDRFGELVSVAGFDVSYGHGKAHAAAVVLDWESLEVQQEIRLTVPVEFPYISTYLAYREFDAVAHCFSALETAPSLLLVDGNGTLHPHRMGMACYVGLKLDRPTIGVAKSLLTGRPDRAHLAPGESAPVRMDGPLAGHAFRPPSGKPIYVSPGHRVSADTALRHVRRLCRARIPEPLRLADRAARRQRLSHEG